MNFKKTQLFALALIVCCTAALPMQAEAKKKENKITAESRVVVSSLPRSLNQKEAVVSTTVGEERRVTTPNQSSASLGNVTVAAKQNVLQSDSYATKKAAKQKLKDDKKRAQEATKQAKKNKKKGKHIKKPTQNTANPTKSGGNSVATAGTASKSTTPTVLPVGYQEIGIFGEAVAEKAQAVALLKKTSPDLQLNFSAEEIVEIYWEEAGREGVRQDLAFAQALVETGFFRFGGDVKPEQNNFCGLGTTGGGVNGAHFPTPQIGARAHIQHLLAYTTQKHPSTKIVDPRYDLAHAIRLERGLCDTWYKLNGTWAMSSGYSEKIMGIWQRMLAIGVAEAKEFYNKKDDKVKPEEHTAEDKHRMREIVDELLKENK